MNDQKLLRNKGRRPRNKGGRPPGAVNQPKRKVFGIYVTPEAIEKLGPDAAMIIRNAVEAGKIS